MSGPPCSASDPGLGALAHGTACKNNKNVLVLYFCRIRAGSGKIPKILNPEQTFGINKIVPLWYD
jgi:hypothetical protein